MTVAALIKIGLVVYGLLLGAAVLYLRWHPEAASRVVFEWRARSGVVAGELIGSHGVSDTKRLAYRSVELLGEAFGERMSAIAGETRRTYEALAAREFVRLQEQESSRYARRLGEIDRRVAQVDAEIAHALAEASTPEPTEAPLPSEPFSTEPPPAPEPWSTGSPQADAGESAVIAEQDPVLPAAREALTTARYRLDLARQRLVAREQEYLVLRRRSYVREHLRLAARLVPEGVGVALELTVVNDGDLAALRLTLVIAVGETPLAIENGRVKSTEAGGASRVVPHIVNEFGEIIRGLPPQFRWDARFPYEGAGEDTLLARARDSATGRTRFVAGIADADLAPMDRLRPTTPADGGGAWTYPETSLEELFRDDLAAALVGFSEAGDVAQAERTLARARRDLEAAEQAAVERALWARRLDAWPKGTGAGGPFVVPPAPPPPPSYSPRPSPTPETSGIVAGLRSERERLLAERAETAERLDQLRAGTGPDFARLREQARRNPGRETLERLNWELREKLEAARAASLKGATRTDPSDDFRFEGVEPGTYYVYGRLQRRDGGDVHFLQKVMVDRDGQVVLDAPVVTTSEELFLGVMNAGS